MEKTDKEEKKPRFGSIKSALGKNNKLTAGISFLFLFVIMFGLFAFILIGLYGFGLIELPVFVQNLLFGANGGEPEAEKDDKNIYDYLAQNSGPENYGSEGGLGFVVEITIENVRDAIANVKLPDNLYLKMEARYYINNEISRTEEMTLWKKGEKYKYLLSVDSVLEESYINDSKYERIENFATGGGASVRKASAFSFGDIPHMPDINHYLGLLEGGEITSCEIIQNDDSNVVQIEYVLPQINQRELIYVSLDTGVVLEVCSNAYGDNSDKHYQCVTTGFAYYDGDKQAEAIAPIQDSLFEIE